MLHALHMNETTTCDTPVDELKEMNPEVVSDDDEGDQMEKDFQLDEASCFMNGHGSHRTSIYIAAKISPHFSKDFLVEDDDSTASKTSTKHSPWSSDTPAKAFGCPRKCW